MFIYWSIGLLVAVSGGYLTYLAASKAPDIRNEPGGLPLAWAVHGFCVFGVALTVWTQFKVTSPMRRETCLARSLFFAFMNGFFESFMQVGTFDAGRALVRL